MKTIQTISKILFYAALFITGFLNIWGGIAMLVAKDLNKGVALCVILFTLGGLGAAFIFAVKQKWGIALIISMTAAIVVTAISYYLVTVGFDRNLYLRNHASILFVPVFGLVVWGIDRALKR